MFLSIYLETFRLNLSTKLKKVKENALRKLKFAYLCQPHDLITVVLRAVDYLKLK